MNMRFGKYRGKPVAWVLIEKPKYFLWMKEKGLDKYPEYSFALSLIEKLDAMPFAVRCSGAMGCENPVTRLTLYRQQFNGAHWFCDCCDPYKKGATDGYLFSVRKVSEVLCHEQIDDIIMAFYQAKGGLKIKTEAALRSFFEY